MVQINDIFRSLECLFLCVIVFWKIVMIIKDDKWQEYVKTHILADKLPKQVSPYFFFF